MNTKGFFMTIKRKHIVNLMMLILFCGILVTKYFFYDFYKIPQKGMYPTVRASKRFLCKKNPYKSISDVQQGDIVVFKGLWKDGKKYNFIWRVVGLPGDTIVIQTDQVVINGNTLKKEKIDEESELIIYKETNGNAVYSVAYSKSPDPENLTDGEYTIPENHVFVLGDNRDNAYDSRHIGTIPFDSIFAKKL